MLSTPGTLILGRSVFPEMTFGVGCRRDKSHDLQNIHPAFFAH